MNKEIKQESDINFSKVDIDYLWLLLRFFSEMGLETDTANFLAQLDRTKRHLKPEKSKTYLKREYSIEHLEALWEEWVKESEFTTDFDSKPFIAWIIERYSLEKGDD